MNPQQPAAAETLATLKASNPDPPFCCRRRLVEVGGRSSSVRLQELQELQAVALSQHLEANPFAKSARRRRSNVVLSCYRCMADHGYQ
jgi:hypothetical protein